MVATIALIDGAIASHRGDETAVLGHFQLVDDAIGRRGFEDEDLEYRQFLVDRGLLQRSPRSEIEHSCSQLPGTLTAVLAFEVEKYPASSNLEERNVDVIICRDREKVGEVAAQYVAAGVEGKDLPVLGFATGSSPLGLYEALARRVADGSLKLSHARGFALDEYVGIPLEHPESYHAVIRRTVVEPLGLDPALVRVPDGLAEDVDAAAARYDADIVAAGGIDVQILGIGANGHIGFNEPFTSFGSITHKVALTERTRSDNARFFDSLEQVPTHAVSQGLATIMRSRRAVLVASGSCKAEAIAAMIEGPVAARCPASLLQFHPDVVVVVDEAAAEQLQHREHFRTV